MSSMAAGRIGRAIGPAITKIIAPFLYGEIVQ
jgi:hypothetical protein